MMRASVALVGLFLISYVSKVLLIGREDRASWTDASIWILYVHECCIALMIIAAGVGLLRTRRFGELRDGDVRAPEARDQDRRVHRIVGRVAVVAGIVALLTSGGVLVGMFERAGV